MILWSRFDGLTLGALQFYLVCGLLKQRHLLLQVIDLLTECIDLSGQQVKRSGWLFNRWRLASAFAITDRVSIGVPRTWCSHGSGSGSFGALRPRTVGYGS